MGRGCLNKAESFSGSGSTVKNIKTVIALLIANLEGALPLYYAFQTSKVILYLPSLLEVVGSLGLSLEPLLVRLFLLGYRVSFIS